MALVRGAGFAAAGLLVLAAAAGCSGSPMRVSCPEYCDQRTACAPQTHAECVDACELEKRTYNLRCSAYFEEYKAAALDDAAPCNGLRKTSTARCKWMVCNNCGGECPITCSGTECWDGLHKVYCD